MNAMEQFNASEANRTKAINQQNTLDSDKFNNQLVTQINQYNADLDFKTDSWNAQNAQAVEQSNIAWRRSANTATTAAQNAANQAASNFAFNMSTAEQNYLWQKLRDEATFAQATLESDKERALNLLVGIYGNKDLMTENNTASKRARNALAPALEIILDMGLETIDSQ